MQNIPYYQPYTARFLIEQLQLQPHPEGGYFKETYRASENFSHLPARFVGAERSCSTAIYYLLEANQRSAFHKILSDELWHFHAGVPLEVVGISPQGDFKRWLVGPKLNEGQQFQVVIPAGYWFGSRPLERDSQNYTLVGCTVAPGFDFKDFEMAKRSDLLATYPQYRDVILEFT